MNDKFDNERDDKAALEKYGTPPNPPAAPPEWAVKAWNEICDTPFPSMSMFATGRECLKARAKVAAAIIARHAPVLPMREKPVHSEDNILGMMPVANNELVERLTDMRERAARSWDSTPEGRRRLDNDAKTLTDAIAALSRPSVKPAGLFIEERPENADEGDK